MIHLKDMECFREGFDDVHMPWSTAGGKNPAFDIDEQDREAWTAAVDLANDLKDLGLKERLRRLEELGLRTDGELDAEESYTEYLVGRYGKEKTEEIFASFEEDKEVHKWGHKYAYEQKLKDDRAEAEKLSVIQHMKGWEIWPLIGNERETKDRIEPDRTDQNLTGIFVENGEWAMYQYGLEPGNDIDS